MSRRELPLPPIQNDSTLQNHSDRFLRRSAIQPFFAVTVIRAFAERGFCRILIPDKVYMNISTWRNAIDERDTFAFTPMRLFLTTQERG